MCFVLGKASNFLWCASPSCILAEKVNHRNKLIRHSHSCLENLNCSTSKSSSSGIISGNYILLLIVQLYHHRRGSVLLPGIRRLRGPEVEAGGRGGQGVAAEGVLQVRGLANTSCKSLSKVKTDHYCHI